MAYYNGFPATYQPMYPQIQAPVMQTPQQVPVMQTPQQSSGISVVQIQGGEQTAKSYLVAPNTTVQLWDMEEKTLFIKSADASGMPSLKVLDFTVRGEAPAKKEYATKDELNALADKIREMKDELAGKRRSRLTKEEDDE